MVFLYFASLLTIREPVNIILALELGQHITSPKVEFIECVVYLLEPSTVGSFNLLEEEVIESGPIQASVFLSATTFSSTGCR